MGYPFVQAANDYGPRKGPVLAFVVHMAEGGGTVGFLSRPNLRGVSVHYVIEYSGRIVRMLAETHASGSINPTDLRSTDGPAPFGASAARAVLGPWARDPNSAVITVEVEGFAATGPNDAQRAALVALVNDVRSRYPKIGILGHRDFTSRKACPGPHIPWPALGGHGPMTVQTITPPASIGDRPAGSEGWVVAKRLEALWTVAGGVARRGPAGALTFAAWYGPTKTIRTASGSGTFREILSGPHHRLWIHTSDAGLAWHAAGGTP